MRFFCIYASPSMVTAESPSKGTKLAGGSDPLTTAVSSFIATILTRTRHFPGVWSREGRFHLLRHEGELRSRRTERTPEAEKVGALLAASTCAAKLPDGVAEGAAVLLRQYSPPALPV